MTEDETVEMIAAIIAKEAAPAWVRSSLSWPLDFTEFEHRCVRNAARAVVAELKRRKAPDDDS